MSTEEIEFWNDEEARIMMRLREAGARKIRLREDGKRDYAVFYIASCKTGHFWKPPWWRREVFVCRRSIKTKAWAADGAEIARVRRMALDGLLIALGVDDYEAEQERKRRQAAIQLEAMAELERSLGTMGPQG